jgi:hypothetical protein
MRSGSHVQLAALRNRDLELQTTSPFSNHGSVERWTAFCRHKTFYMVGFLQSFRFFVSLCITKYLTRIRFSGERCRCFWQDPLTDWCRRGNKASLAVNYVTGWATSRFWWTAFITRVDSAVKITLLCLQINGTSLIDWNGPQQLCVRDESFTLRKLGCYWLMNRIWMTKLAVWIVMQVRLQCSDSVYLNRLVSGVYFFWKNMWLVLQKNSMTLLTTFTN